MEHFSSVRVASTVTSSGWSGRKVWRAPSERSSDRGFSTVAELRGRQPVVRGGLRFTLEPGALRNPRSAYHVPGQTGGSRSPGVALAIDLRFVRDVAADLAASMGARGAAGWHVAYWDVPGGTIRPLLVSAKAGHPPHRWFSLVDAASPDVPGRYRWSARAIRWGSRLSGIRLPAPEHVPVSDPLPVARWIRQVLEAGQTPLLLTYSSPGRAPRRGRPRRGPRSSRRPASDLR